MKIALVHDYLKEYGGAEGVLETLSDLFPDAPIYTSLYCPHYLGPHRPRLEKKWAGRIHQSFFRFIPFAPKLISLLRLLSPLAFRLFDFSTFDLIISSATGAYFPNAVNKKSAKLVCYCHTPPRYLYGLPTARNLTTNRFLAALAAVLNHFLRLLDFKFAQNVDQFVANSRTTAARIQKFYRKSSVVINPPVELPKKLKIENWKLKFPGNEYYLAGGRLARAKRYDIAIQACNQLKLPLKVFGRDFAGFESELKKIAGLPAVASAEAGPTIEFVGEVTNDQKYQLMSQSQAFIFCSDNEDFGIMPVEAMACGTPVVAYRSGGVTETVLDGQTGVLFDELTPSSCAAAIQKLQKLKIKSQNCRSRARLFSRPAFIQKITNLIKNI